MPIIDFEKIPARDMLPPHSSKQNISFLQLPREIRDPIYRHSIIAGNFAILRLTKLVHEEASQFLPKHATLRINLGFVNRTNWSELRSASVTPLVQHVHLRIEGTSDAAPFDITTISGLLDKQVVRESCFVTLEYGKGAAPYHPNRRMVYRHLARLGGFKKLVFRIEIERYELGDFGGGMSERGFHEIFHYDTHLLAAHETSYMQLQKYMEPSLGPAIVDHSVEGHCLEFHPLEPVPEGWHSEFQPLEPFPYGWYSDEECEDDEDEDDDQDEDDGEDEDGDQGADDD